MKLYSPDFDDCCVYTLDVIQEMMENEGIERAEVSEMKPDTMKGYFFCGAVFEVCDDDGQSCGKFCSDYAPRNGKFGICRHKGRTYTPTGKKRIITIKIKED